MSLSEWLSHQRRYVLTSFGSRRPDPLGLSKLAGITLQATSIPYVPARQVNTLRVLAFAVGSLVILDVCLLFTQNFDEIAKLATFVLALVGSIVALRQWSRVRHENTIEKYYDRVGAINVIIDSYHKAAAKDDPGAASGQFTHIVALTELLTLEYVLLKFELGYCDLAILERALMSFFNRCGDKSFADATRLWIGNSDPTVRTSYRKNTKLAALALLEQASTTPSLS